MRYDAAIIGAGADGLAAAATLAKSGLKVIVLERAEHPGGRCITREFHPDFHASPFQDEIAPIPAEVFWSLDLARHGAVFMPTPVSTALWPDRADTLRRNDAALKESAAMIRNALARAQAEAAPKRKTFFGRSDQASPWPGEALATTSLDDAVFRHSEGADQTAHLMARALSGRAAQPALAGSALHLLASDSGGLVAGGLQRLTDALVAAAQEAGAEIS